MRITFARSIAIAGEHQEQGSTAEVSDATAALLIAQGAAQVAPEAEEVKPKPKKADK